MKKTLRAMAVLLACLLMLISLAACSKEQDKSELTVAITADRAGFCYINANGAAEGFDVELMTLIAAKCGYTVIFSNIAPDGFDLAAKKGDADVFIGTVEKGDALKDLVSYSEAYYGERYIIAVPQESEIKKPLDVEGHVVGAVLGSRPAQLAGNHYNCDLSHFGSNAELVEALKVGVVDAIALADEDKTILPEGFVVVDEAMEENNYCIAVHKDLSIAGGKINKALGEMISDGTVDKLLAKYGIIEGGVSASDVPVE